MIDYNIKRITALETYLVRHPILRNKKPIESCDFDGDHLETTIHLGLYYKKQLIGVCSLLKNNHVLYFDTNQYQLRGMAILTEFQGKGLGLYILKHVESILINNSTLIWCNAREIAINFYKKSGYTITGKPFEIKTAGIHYMMYKKL